MTLQEFFRLHPRAALGLSGGVDSAYLLYAARHCGAQVRPYFVKTAFQPDFELEDARQLCRALGAELTVVELDVLADTAVRSNPADRCYHCKKQLFTTLQTRSAADGFPLLLDGTNASDDAGDRPGMQALRELEVLSPLRLCGITKAQVRREAHRAGLAVWNKPAYACLATRIPADTPLTGVLLGRIAGAEDALRQLGYSDLRVRYFHGAARLQLPRDQQVRAIAEAETIRRALAPWFTELLLDFKERSSE